MQLRLRTSSARVQGLIVVFGVVLLALAFWVVWDVLPNRSVDDSKFSPQHFSARYGNNLEAQRLKARNDTRTVGAQVLGVLAVFVGGLATWRTVRLTREGQLTDRYSSAIDQLGDKENGPIQRLGGIYALERIARDSARDHWPIMEILVGHVRHVAPRDDERPPSQPQADVRAIATVLSRRKAKRESNDQILQLWRLDLRNVRLNHARLRRSNFADADLSGAYLEQACLDGAHLDRAVLRGSHLQGASLIGVSLEGADLVGADLRDVDFAKAELALATFYEAEIAGAKRLPRWAIEQAALHEPPRLHQSRDLGGPSEPHEGQTDDD
jgi:hypothetical protein